MNAPAKIPNIKGSSWTSNLEAYAYLAPAGLILLVFWCAPAVFSVFVSFTNWHGGDALADVKWVGLENYRMAFHDQRFFKTLWNTVNYVIWSVPLTLILSLSVALLLTLKIRGMALFRTAFFLPYVTTWVAVSILWSYIFQQNFGLANCFLEFLDKHLHLGVGPLKWLNEPRGVIEMAATWMGQRLGLLSGDQIVDFKHPLLEGPSLAMFSIIITSVWRDTGYFMLIFIAGLNEIDPTYYEAAEIDGAGPWTRFRHITLPLLSPVTFFLLVVAMIGAFKVYVPMMIMTPGGGPSGTTSTLVYFLYEEGFMSWRLGYASAIAYVLFVIILAMTLLQNKVIGGKVHYE